MTVVMIVATAIVFFMCGRLTKFPKVIVNEPKRPIHAKCASCGHNISSHHNGGKGKCDVLVGNRTDMACACMFFTYHKELDPEIEAAKKKVELARLDLQALELTEKAAGIK